jgi:hypothetical protein
MTVWNSAEEITSRFRLAAPSGDLPGVLAELKRRMVEAHPDRNGGEFPTLDHKAEFIDLQSGIEYVEQLSRSQNALVPVTQVTALVEAMTQALARRERMPDLTSETHLKLIQDVRSSLRGAYFGPKITSGVALAISSGLFVFMGSLKDHPILGNLVREPSFGNLLITAWLASGGLFLLLWYRERQSESRADYLLSDEIISHIFPLLCETTVNPRRGRRRGVFTVSELANLIETWWNWGRRTVERELEGPEVKSLRDDEVIRFLSRIIRLLRGRSIDASLSQRIARDQIAKLTERRAVRKLDDPDVAEWYAIDPSLLQRYIAGYEAE